MTESIRTQVREAQQSHLDNLGDRVSPEAKEKTMGMYDAIDTLNAEQRSLLIDKALQGIAMNLLEAGKADHPALAASYLVTARACLAIAGYANSLTAEEHEEWTSTGDKKVFAILEDLADVVRMQGRAALSPEEQNVADEVMAKAQSRADAGEDYATALMEEAEKAEKEWLASHPAEGVAAVAASAAADDPGYGLYL